MRYYIARKDGTKEDVTDKVFYWNRFNAKQMVKYSRYLGARGKQGQYKDRINTYPLFLDTETSHISDEKGWIYQWAICINFRFIIGRTPEQLIYTLKQFIDLAGEKRKFLVYVHNLSYDMQYLKDYLIQLDPTMEMFALRSHKILTARLHSMEFRCSYMMTAKSLDKWSKDSAKLYRKAVGAISYSDVRYQDTELTENDWYYQLSDVACMCDAYTNDMQGYTVQNIPLTSTGYVRKDCKKESENEPFWRDKFNNLALDARKYMACNKAFAGGYTHNNRFHHCETVYGNIGHIDFRSSYPSWMMIKKNFPTSPLFLLANHLTRAEYEKWKSNHCLIMHVCFRNIHLKDNKITMPYIQRSKMEGFLHENKLSLDNGRLLRYLGDDSEFWMWITEIDLDIIQSQYAGEIYIADTYASEKGYLPTFLRTMVMKYFTEKQTLKHSDPATYMRSKARLNSLYGMCATALCRDTFTFNWETHEWNVENITGNMELMEEQLRKYYKSRNSFLPYQYGIYVTALARRQLFTVFEMIGYANILYSDTDSCFYLSTPETEKAVAEYNAMIEKEAEATGAYIDQEGKRVYLGVMCHEEDEPITAFRGLHSKCYALEGKNGLQVTVAGVTKCWRSDPNKTNADELGCIDALGEGFRFVECGGTQITYVEDMPHSEDINGHTVTLSSAAIITDTDYTVKLLNEIDIFSAEAVDMDDLNLNMK